MAADCLGLDQYLLIILTRLHLDDEGRVVLRFKRRWRNGREGVRLTPAVFILRLANLLMPSGVNLTRYHGVFGPASPLRSRVVPEPPPDPVSRPKARWIRWAVLLWHVFGKSAEDCPRCGEPMRRVGTLQHRAWEVLDWIERWGERLGRPP
ncbi:MAG: hypothetical protein ACI8PZ_007108 [Myxococcota bacterium]|jgi:hypothetical protein